MYTRQVDDIVTRFFDEHSAGTSSQVGMVVVCVAMSATAGWP